MATRKIIPPQGGSGTAPATKQKYKDEALGPAQTPNTAKQVLDDQTPVDDNLKKSKGYDLQGYDKRLPAGNEREIHIDPSKIGNKNPIIVTTISSDLKSEMYDDIKIEGESRIVHDSPVICGVKSSGVCVRTSASILVKKVKPKK